MDEARRNGVPSIESDIVTCPGGTTSGLDERFSCVRRRVRHSNWECLNATYRTDMVPLGVLCESELSKSERNYSTTEREALGMVYNVTKYRHYLLGCKFSFHVDHSALINWSPRCR